MTFIEPVATSAAQPQNATGPGRPEAGTERRTARRSYTLIVGCALAGSIALLALVALFWLPYATDDTSGGRLAGPDGDHLLGTDKLGRDLLTQVMNGATIAFQAGLGSVLIAGTLGLALGLLAAFAQGWLDDTLSVFLDILIAFPTLLLAMLVVAARSGTLGSAVLAIGLAQSAVVARIVRILVKRVLAQDYITAARTSGTSWGRIVAGHVLPNIWPTLAVNLALQFGLAVLAEAGLSYLGLGAPPPNASWGRLLLEAQATFTTAPIGALAPGILLVILVIGVNLIADGLRDTLDPTTRERPA
ncbi:ABC transporter permease [Streptomyces sp. NPDC020965]|uniref:ABC transporter permease n=1 Tax=Streptomyces sp. NPDC020965 TaxID=3365105 RepID=UPI0037A746D3